MPSIEIFVKDFDEKKFNEHNKRYNNIECQISSPAISHREPSLWQRKFNSFGSGYLYHIGNIKPNILDDSSYLFYAYDLIKEYDLNGYYRFKSECWSDIKILLKNLLKYSLSNKLYFSSDMQLMNIKKKTQYMTLEKFFELHDLGKLQFNTIIAIGILNKKEIIRYNKNIYKKR